MTKITAVLLPAATLLAHAATSLAGGKADQVVEVTPATFTMLANANGSMAATRATTDAFAKIGCWAVGSPGSVTVACLATDPNNVTIACSSTVAGVVKAIQGVNPASHIAFTVAADGTCDNVAIDDSSGYGLKK